MKTVSTIYYYILDSRAEQGIYCFYYDVYFLLLFFECTRFRIKGSLRILTLWAVFGSESDIVCAFGSFEVLF